MKEEKYYVITRLHKDDIRGIFNGNKEALKVIDDMTDDDMERLCSKLEDDYCNQLFWDSLRVIFEDRFLRGGL